MVLGTEMRTMEGDDLRETILAAPEKVLEDREVMRALVGAETGASEGKIVDLRGIAMERLESRLDRLEDTHRSVIAAAYENLAGTNQVHRAILAMLDPTEFEPFLRNLGTEVAAILRVDVIRLVLESPQAASAAQIEQRLGDVLVVRPPGFIDTYIDAGREGMPARTVTLRQASPTVAPSPHRTTQIGRSRTPYGEHASWVASEALIRLDFGPGRQAGMLAMGAEDPHQFKPAQGTDLLSFFGGIFERQMRRWLS
ncbi:MAG: DUF484 family protein [Pseudomonadota bacterium]